MQDRSEAGFSYIDVMIALTILLVGILSLLSALSGSILQARSHDQQVLAKQVATSALESIMSVKETDPTRLGWNAVGNVGSNPDSNGTPQGIFLSGWQPVFSDPGPDEVIGTADDTGLQLSNLQRRITITDVCDPDRPSPVICNPSGNYKVKVRSVAIAVQYGVGGINRQEILNTVLTDYSIASQ